MSDLTIGKIVNNSVTGSALNSLPPGPAGAIDHVANSSVNMIKS